MRVADNPKATVKQIMRLAKKDVEAALRHPNAPLEFLLDRGSLRVQTVLSNPAWPLHKLSNPSATLAFECGYRIRSAEGSIERLAFLTAGTDVGMLRLLAWAIECAVMAAPVHRRWYPEEYRPVLARRMALRWLTGLATQVEVARTTFLLGNVWYEIAPRNNWPAYQACHASYHALNCAQAASTMFAQSTARSACAATAAALYPYSPAPFPGPNPVPLVQFWEGRAARLTQFKEGKVVWVEKILAMRKKSEGLPSFAL